MDGKVRTSHILIWNFKDPIHPQMVLEAPYDVESFRFNPQNANKLVAGCTSGVEVSVCTFALVSKYVGTSKASSSCSVTFELRTSGQILLYDLTDAKASLAKRDKASSRWLYSYTLSVRGIVHKYKC